MKNKDIKRTSLILFISIAIISGIIYYYLLDETTKINITDIITKQFLYSNNLFNNLLIHLMSLIILIVLSYFIIGSLLLPLYFFFELFSIGFSLSIFINIYKVNGFIYSLIFNIIGKLIYLLCLYYLIKYLYKVIVNNYHLLFKRKQFNIDILINSSKKVILYLFIIIINDVILRIFGVTILKFFNFLI